MDIINMRSYSDPIKFVTNNCKIVYNYGARNTTELELEDKSILILESFQAYIELCAEGRIIKSREIKDGVKLFVDENELLNYLTNRDEIGNFTYKNNNVKEVEEYKVKTSRKGIEKEFDIIRFIV